MPPPLPRLMWRMYNAARRIPFCFLPFFPLYKCCQDWGEGVQLIPYLHTTDVENPPAETCTHRGARDKEDFFLLALPPIPRLSCSNSRKKGKAGLQCPGVFFCCATCDCMQPYAELLLLQDLKDSLEGMVVSPPKWQPPPPIYQWSG